MNCQFCGNSLGLGAYFRGERDFCTPAHRRKFHDRLRFALQRVAQPRSEFMAEALSIKDLGCAGQQGCFHQPVLAPFFRRSPTPLHRPVFALPIDPRQADSKPPGVVLAFPMANAVTAQFPEKSDIARRGA